MSTYSVPVITQTNPMAVHRHPQQVPQSPHDPNQQSLSLQHQGHLQGHPQLFWAQYPQVQAMPVPAHMMAVPMCEVKAQRLTREQLNYLESIFQQNSRPTSAMKRGFAEAMRVPVEKINNWFQNRRAKVKQEIKKAQHAAAAQAEQQNGEQGEHRHGVVLPEGVRQYSIGSDHAPSTGPPAILPSNDTSGPPEMSPTTILQSSIPQIFQEPSYSSALSQDQFVDHPPVSHVSSTTYSIPEETVAAPPTLHFDQMAVPYGVGNDFGGLGGMLLNTAFVPEPERYFMSPVQQPSVGESPLPPKAGINVVVSSAAPDLPNGIPTPTYSEACIPQVKMEFSPLPWTPDAEVRSINARDSPLDPLDSRDSKPAGHDTPIDATGWPSGLDNLNGYFPPQFSETPTPAVSVTPEMESQQLGVGIMEPPEYPSQAYDRRCSSTTTLVDSLGNVSIQAPFPLQNDLKKPSQTIAARRQRRPAALNSSAFRSASYSHGIPSPGCLTAPPELNLRKIKSTGIAIGSRISKPLNSAGPKSPFQFNDMYCSSPSFQQEIHSSSVSTPSFFITTPGWWSSEDVHSTDSFEGLEKSRLETY